MTKVLIILYRRKSVRLQTPLGNCHFFSMHRLWAISNRNAFTLRMQILYDADAMIFTFSISRVNCYLLFENTDRFCHLLIVFVQYRRQLQRTVAFKIDGVKYEHLTLIGTMVFYEETSSVGYSNVICAVPFFCKILFARERRRVSIPCGYVTYYKMRRWHEKSRRERFGISPDEELS